MEAYHERSRADRGVRSQFQEVARRVLEDCRARRERAVIPQSGVPPIIEEMFAMGQIRERIHIDAPPEKVWELGADAERFPEWQTGVVRVKDVSGPIDHVGAHYTMVYRTMGRELE